MKGADAVRAAIAVAEERVEGGGRDLTLARKSCNDSGNGERLRARWGRDLVFVRKLGWLGWSGSHWSEELGERQVAIAAQKTAAAIFEEAAALDEAGEPEAAKRLRAWAIDSGNQARLAAMVKVSEPHRERELADLDRDGWLLNVQNGTLELAGGEVRRRRHARLDLLTRIAAVGHDAAARCPLFDGFLAQILPDPAVRRFVQRALGYALSADMREQKVVLLWGAGANGKSTLVNLVRWLLGGYAAAVNFETLTADRFRRGSEASPDLAQLVGVRALFAAEPAKGAKLDEGRIKMLTGGETIKTRKLNRDFFDLVPLFKPFLSFNNKPVIQDNTYGMWRRVLLVPFTQTFDEKTADKELPAKLKAEGPGILNWLIDGLLLWREEGLAPPEAVTLATATYRKASDPLGEFLNQACVVEDGAATASADLYGCYVGWCGFMGSEPITATLFGRILGERGHDGEKLLGKMHRKGLRLLDTFDWDWKPWVPPPKG